MNHHLPSPATAPELFESLLIRRVIAYFIDVAIMTAIFVVILVVGLVAGIFSWGAGAVGAVVALPLSPIVYYAYTLGSPKRATVGMQLQDIVLTTTRERPLNGWRAFFHPLVFWITCWILPPFSYLVALFTPRRQMIHDLVTGTLMVRRSPMERHWRETQ